MTEKKEIKKNINSKLKPTEVKEWPWLIEENEKISVKYYNLDCLGKWMLYYHKDDLDEAWESAKKYYNNDDLDGVVSLQVSTEYEGINKSEYIDTGVILFICSESYDETHILKTGKNIINKMNYSPLSGAYVYYKTNTQTSIGNRTTGEKKNYFYKIEV